MLKFSHKYIVTYYRIRGVKLRLLQESRTRDGETTPPHPNRAAWRRRRRRRAANRRGVATSTAPTSRVALQAAGAQDTTPRATCVFRGLISSLFPSLYSLPFAVVVYSLSARESLQGGPAAVQRRGPAWTFPTKRWLAHSLVH